MHAAVQPLHIVNRMPINGAKDVVPDSHVGAPPADCDPKIRRIFDHWKSIHPAAGLPGRQHFDPLDVPSLLPNILLIDVPTETSGFAFRLMGTAVEYFFGGNLQGTPLVDAYTARHESPAHRDVCGVVADHMPRWWKGRARYVRNRDHVVAERIHLPLATDGKTVDLILGLLVANTQFRNFV